MSRSGTIQVTLSTTRAQLSLDSIAPPTRSVIFYYSETVFAGILQAEEVERSWCVKKGAASTSIMGMHVLSLTRAL